MLSVHNTRQLFCCQFKIPDNYFVVSSKYQTTILLSVHNTRQPFWFYFKVPDQPFVFVFRKADHNFVFISIYLITYHLFLTFCTQISSQSFFSYFKYQTTVFIPTCKDTILLNFFFTFFLYFMSLQQEKQDIFKCGNIRTQSHFS